MAKVNQHFPGFEQLIDEWQMTQTGAISDEAVGGVFLCRVLAD